MGSAAAVIGQLNSARDIVLRDPTIYPQIVPGVLPVIGANAGVELRRWGADFLAETFASPVVSPDAKQQMCIGVLDTLKGYLDRKNEHGGEEDPSVVKSAIQCTTSVYPYVFRHTITNAKDSETWAKMAGLKSSILRRMDTAVPGVRICCIKFVARVVQVQTPGMISDPRRPEQNEISLALVPRDHPVLTQSNLEAEASGLLDRLLGVLYDYGTDPLLVTAVLNCLSSLVQRRPSVSQKIISAVLNFNPLKLAEGKMTAKDKVAVRSMARTTVSFMHHILKRSPNQPAIGRLQQAAERLRVMLDEALSDRGLKRSRADELTDGMDERKRQKTDFATMNGTQSAPHAPPALPDGPITLAQLFTLSTDPAAVGFHVEVIPHDTVTRLLPPLLQAIPREQLDQAINIVQKRFLDRTSRTVTALDTARAATGEDDDDDYDPSATFSGTDQVLNNLGQLPPTAPEPELTIGPFNLPPPPPLSEAERQEYSRTMLVRVFGNLAELDRQAKSKGAKKPDGEKGFNRILSGTHDREAWISLVTRLATRADADADSDVSKADGDGRSLVKKGQSFDFSDGIRQALMNYIMEDFRRRIDVAISWLNEEWYSERLRQGGRTGQNGSTSRAELTHYWTYTLRLLDLMTPYLDVKDSKTMIRFLSEIPDLNSSVMERLKALANDPEKVQVTTQTLLYLSMFRPPVREMVVDTAEALWRENSDAKNGASKILSRWRPAVLEEIKQEVKTEE